MLLLVHHLDCDSLNSTIPLIDAAVTPHTWTSLDSVFEAHQLQEGDKIKTEDLHRVISVTAEHLLVWSKCQQEIPDMKVVIDTENARRDQRFQRFATAFQKADMNIVDICIKEIVTGLNQDTNEEITGDDPDGNNPVLNDEMTPSEFLADLEKIHK